MTYQCTRKHQRRYWMSCVIKQWYSKITLCDLNMHIHYVKLINWQKIIGRIMDKLFLFFWHWSISQKQFNIVRILKSTHIKFTDTNLILISCSTFHVVTWFCQLVVAKITVFQASFKIHIIASYCFEGTFIIRKCRGNIIPLF